MFTDYDRIIFKKDVYPEIINFAKSYKRTLIVASFEAGKKYLQGLLSGFGEAKLSFSVLYLSHSSDCTEENIQRVCKKAGANYPLILAFGGNSVIDLAKCAASKLGCDAAALPSVICHYGFLSDNSVIHKDGDFFIEKTKAVSKIFIDEEIIASSPAASVLSTLAFITSHLEYATTEKIQSLIYELPYAENCDRCTGIVLKAEALINWLAMGNREAILTLFEYVLEMGTVVGEKTQSASSYLANMTRNFNMKNKFGMRSLFCAEILLLNYKRYFSQKVMSTVDMPEIKYVAANSESYRAFLSDFDKYEKAQLFYKLRAIRVQALEIVEKNLERIRKQAKKLTVLGENYEITKYVDEDKLFSEISNLPSRSGVKLLRMMKIHGFTNFSA